MESFADMLARNYALMGANATDGNPAALSGSGWGGQSHAELNASWQPTAAAQAAVPNWNPAAQQAPTYTPPAAQPSYGGYGGGFSGTSSQVPIANDPYGGGGLGSNPYRQDALNFLKQDMLDFTGKAINNNNSSFAGVGGLGGSRNKLFNADIINQAGRNYGSTAANMLSGDYQFDRNLNTSSYNTNRGLDLQQMGLGAQMLGQGTNLPWVPYNSASGLYGQYSGMGGNDSGSNWQQILGGLVSGAGLAGKMGLWG